MMVYAMHCHARKFSNIYSNLLRHNNLLNLQNSEMSRLKGEYVGYNSAEDELSTLGLSSSLVIERVTANFRRAGGVVLEGTTIKGICVSKTAGAAIDVGESNEPITAKLLVDCLGKLSTIASQNKATIKPNGLCAILGTSSSGYDMIQSTNGDVVMNTDDNDFSNGKTQYFYEAPAAQVGSKVIYMFTCMDADQDRPSLESLINDYWKMLPKYQTSITNPETDLDIQQLVVAFFPMFPVSPLQPKFDRIFPISDTSGIESPLNFDNFGTMCRNLDWLTSAIIETFDQGQFEKERLSDIYTHAPILSSAWMYQKAAEIRIRHTVDKAFLRRLISTKIESDMIQNVPTAVTESAEQQRNMRFGR